MTSDAKVGLLLGLIFIFVIAFIINGLPNLRGQTNTPDIPEQMTQLADNAPGIAATERQANDTLDWQQLIARDNFGLGQYDFEPSQAVNDDVRSVMPLPRLGPVVGGDFDMLETDEGQPTVGLPERIAARQVLDQMQPPGSEPGTPAEPAKDTKPRFYAVVDGDTLAKIALKFYGPEQGNKLVNVTRIFKANGKLLRSPDEISIGQKLLIPPLPPAADKTVQTARDVLSGPQFEVVPSVGSPRPVVPTPALPSTDGGRYYVVRQDDNLWNIAAAQLGSGARYKEIAQLNAGQLPDPSSLSIGMRLRLPPQ